MEIFEDTPKVTIITVVFNAQATIEDTIISVINQTYANLEYIIVDGGSTDGTIKIINRYRERITHFISEPDKGIADGFNKGIAMATGDWIGMINADDWYALNAVKLIMNNRSSNDEVCCGNIMLIGRNGFERSKKSKVSWLNFGMYIMHPTCFIKKEVYQKVGMYDTGLKIAMDFDMFLRIKDNGFKIKHIDETVAYMRTDGVSSDTVKMHREELAVMRRHLKGLSYFNSWIFNYLNRLRWKYFYKDPLRTQLN
jgi:glycosyltransferase involved in cell wall biosynthesis